MIRTVYIERVRVKVWNKQIFMTPAIGMKTNHRQQNKNLYSYKTVYIYKSTINKFVPTVSNQDSDSPENSALDLDEK